MFKMMVNAVMVMMFTPLALSMASASRNLRHNEVGLVSSPMRYLVSSENSLPLRISERLNNYALKMEAEGKMKPVTASNKMAVEAESTGWVYMNAYTNATDGREPCETNLVEQTAFLSGFCLNFPNSTNSFKYVCTSGILSLMGFIDTTCSTGATIGAVDMSCDLSDNGFYYEGVPTNIEFECGDVDEELDWDIDTPNIQQVMYYGATCDDSTEVLAHIMLQDKCYGEMDDLTNNLPVSRMYESPTGYVYAGNLICQGNATQSEDVPLNSCVADGDTVFQTAFQEDNSAASEIMSNLPVIVFIALTTAIFTAM